MPYPVPPPSLPPVVNIQLPEVYGQSVSPSASSPTVFSTPEFAAAQPGTSAASPENCSPEGGTARCDTSTAQLPDPEWTGATVSDAASLGLPLELNGAGVQPASPAPVEETIGMRSLPALDAAIASTWSQTRSAVPELDQLAQSTGSDAPGSTPDSTDADSTAPTRAEPSSPVVPLDRPSAPSLSPSLAPADSAAPASDPATAPDAPPSGSPAPLPNGDPASPAPANGQILTIPGQVPGTTPAPAGTAPAGPPPPVDPVAAGELIELTADRQEYEEQQQVFTGEGNAVLRFRQAVLRADRIQVNIPNRIAVAEGNVALTRGQQTLEGDRFVYNFVQNNGTISGGRGAVFVPAANRDFTSTLPTDVSAGAVDYQALSDRLAANQPSFQVAGSSGGINVRVSGGLPSETSSSALPRNVEAGLAGNVNRLRFEADQIDFDADGWTASNVRITNDPFSPPELELRSPFVTFTRETQTRSVIRARNPRVVFDQGLALPLLVNQLTLDSRRRDPGFIGFGFDERDRDGFYIQRTFNVYSDPIINFVVTPQYLVQRSFEQGNFVAGSSLGLVAELDVNLTPTTSFAGFASFGSLELDKLDQNLRASARLRQRIFGHTLALQYVYRDRIFNGSLGFQTVRRSYGIVLTSPAYTLGNTGINLSYQGSIERINATTDRDDLLAPPLERVTDRATLTRYQISAAASRTFYLWIGKPLPATPTQGLRYTPNPLVPYLALSLGARGVFSAYSNNETQANFTGTLSLSGQFGHFSRPFLDYTAFNVAYSQTALSGESPFRFDRVADERVLSAGITQQIYGPLRFGFQIVLNPDRRDPIATIYTLEYSRRTYAVSLSVSPELETATFTLRISDFNWIGNPGGFSGLGDITPVSGGVQRTNY